MSCSLHDDFHLVWVLLLASHIMFCFLLYPPPFSSLNLVPGFCTMVFFFPGRRSGRFVFPPPTQIGNHEFFARFFCFQARGLFLLSGSLFFSIPVFLFPILSAAPPAGDWTRPCDTPLRHNCFESYSSLPMRTSLSACRRKLLGTRSPNVDDLDQHEVARLFCQMTDPIPPHVQRMIFPIRASVRL